MAHRTLTEEEVDAIVGNDPLDNDERREVEAIAHVCQNPGSYKDPDRVLSMIQQGHLTKVRLQGEANLAASRASG